MKYGQFVKGQSKVCGDREEIRYYQAVEGFRVEMLAPFEEPAKEVPALPPIPKVEILKVVEAPVPKPESHPDTIPVLESVKKPEDSLPSIAVPTEKLEKELAAKKDPVPEPPPVATERGKKRRKTGN
jgi:hypothetical protein